MFESINTQVMLRRPREWRKKSRPLTMPSLYSPGDGIIDGTTRHGVGRLPRLSTSERPTPSARGRASHDSVSGLPASGVEQRTLVRGEGCGEQGAATAGSKEQVSVCCVVLCVVVVVCVCVRVCVCVTTATWLVQWFEPLLHGYPSLEAIARTLETPSFFRRSSSRRSRGRSPPSSVVAAKCIAPHMLTPRKRYGTPRR